MAPGTRSIARAALTWAVAWASMGAPHALAQERGDASAPEHGDARAQDAAAPTDAEIEKLIVTARDGAPPVRPQAAAKLVEAGEPAARALLELAGESPRDLARLGSELVEVLGRFDDPALRAKSWEALGDPDFPWRPAAARSLAREPREAELERFVALLADPLPPVRAAAITAFEALDARARAALLRERLIDENDRVRREAARVLDRFGEHDALAWIVEELRRDDVFFRNPTGKLARAEAARLLAERFGDLAGYRPEKPPSDPENVAAIETLLARVRQLAGGELPALPPIARAGPRGEGDLFGLEIRSCRRGELFLRWNAADRLLVGQGNPVTIDLPPGTAARLAAALAELVAELGDTRAFGVPGCDIEQLHWIDEASGKTRTIVVSKGPEPVAGLRPDALTRLYRALAGSIPAGEEGSAMAELRARLLDALAAVGGPLPPE